jgi:hypothetical protein
MGEGGENRTGPLLLLDHSRPHPSPTHPSRQTPLPLSRTPSGTRGGVSPPPSSLPPSSSSPSSSSPVLLSTPCGKTRDGDGQRQGQEGEGVLGGLYERVAKLALDHHAAFEQDEEEEEEEGAEAEAAAAPFATLAEGRSR